MGCWAQLWCKHEWRHRFVIDGCDTAISQVCWRCGKTKAPMRYWPLPTDEMLDRRDTKKWL